MNDYILSLNDQEVQEFLKDMKNEHFILLLMTLSKEAKTHLFSQLSDVAQDNVNWDLTHFTDHIKKIAPTI